MANLWQTASLLPLPPEIRVQSAQIDDPFSIHFSSRNPSILFAHNHVRYSCSIKTVEGPVVFRNFHIVDGTAPPVDVAPGETAQFTCVLNKLFSMPAKSVESARIEAIISYGTLWLTRRPAVQEFNWDAKSMQWIEGKVVN